MVVMSAVAGAVIGVILLLGEQVVTDLWQTWRKAPLIDHRIVAAERERTELKQELKTLTAAVNRLTTQMEESVQERAELNKRLADLVRVVSLLSNRPEVFMRFDDGSAGIQ